VLGFSGERAVGAAFAEGRTAQSSAEKQQKSAYPGCRFKIFDYYFELWFVVPSSLAVLLAVISLATN
jgi:hypothetical protein